MNKNHGKEFWVYISNLQFYKYILKIRLLINCSKIIRYILKKKKNQIDYIHNKFIVCTKYSIEL